MKVSTLIKQLQNFQKKYGDKEVWIWLDEDNLGSPIDRVEKSMLDNEIYCYLII